MISRTAACLAGIVGGACWVARYALDYFDVTPAGSDIGVVLRWAGATWLLLALFAAGTRLVHKAALWLRLLIGCVVPLLAIIVLSLSYSALPRLVAEAAAGALVVVVSLVLLVRGERSRAAPEHR